MGCRQMGQRPEERAFGVGGGTVRIGRWVMDDIGGVGFLVDALVEVVK